MYFTNGACCAVHRRMSLDISRRYVLCPSSSALDKKTTTEEANAKSWREKSVRVWDLCQTRETYCSMLDCWQQWPLRKTGAAAVVAVPTCVFPAVTGDTIYIHQHIHRDELHGGRNWQNLKHQSLRNVALSVVSGFTLSKESMHLDLI